MLPYFEYHKLGDFTYHVISDPIEIRKYVMTWILHEWEIDHKEALDEHWTVEWMNALPKMAFSLEIVRLEDIYPNSDLMSMENFLVNLKERADQREESILRGVSIEPLLINKNGFELMDGYTRYMVLKKYNQHEVFAYLGTVHDS